MNRWLMPPYLQSPGSMARTARRRWALALLVAASALAPAWATPFRRGDSNADGRLDLADPVHTLLHLFVAGGTFNPTCLDAADADDSGTVNINDPVFTLVYLYRAGPAHAAPGPLNCGEDPTADALTCVSYAPCGGFDPVELQRAGHLLSRAAYGPTFADLERVLTIGTSAWIEEQLNPAAIDESSNTALETRVAGLTELAVRTSDEAIVGVGANWRYHKGRTAPPADWRMPEFDDQGWTPGISGFGYGDDDDSTVLDDMQNNYTSVFIRHQFTLADPAAIRDLVLSVSYDDGFVCYLNGFEVARRLVAGNPPAYNAVATASHEAGGYEDIDISAHKGRLVAGTNVLALQGHNQTLASSDFSLIPQLLDRQVLGGSTTEIKGIGELKALAHVYSVYSRRQLQEVLAEFWENHFLTDFDKLAQYLDDLRNSDATDALSPAQARREAARMDHHEYEFFREHALGNFGDLLRQSATSPTMLIYLDNVLNVRGNANENYAREILELHAFGADAGYTQVDIEELAKCFTGWGVCKLAPEDAGNPHAPCGVQFSDTAIVAGGAAGGSWRYLKGNAAPPANWMDPGFADGAWAQGTAPFGYDNANEYTFGAGGKLTDMFNSYTTVYLRKTFNLTAAQIAAVKNIILRITGEDGWVVYLNGTEAARYYVSGDRGTPVPHDALATQAIERVSFEYNLNRLRGLLVEGPNVIAIQVVNAALSSSDLLMDPSLQSREILGGYENGDLTGVFGFHFHPNLHNTVNTAGRELFMSTPYHLDVPAGRTGTNGILDAEQAIQKILDHPSTPLFISAKLIQKLVGDQIDFRNPAAGPYAALLARCITAWNTPPRGTIKNVVREILTSAEFWSDTARRAKVKTAFEHIASTVRVVGGDTDGTAVVDDLSAMGQELFTRDEPDGWPETGFDWIDTSSLLSRIKFAQAFTEALPAASPGLNWNALPFLDAHGLDTADEIVAFFDNLLFHGTLTDADRAIVTEFLNTDDAYNPLPFSRARTDFGDRVRRAVGLMLSFPQWQFQ